jgi:hypothetical protein
MIAAGEHGGLRLDLHEPDGYDGNGRRFLAGEVTAMSTHTPEAPEPGSPANKQLDPAATSEEPIVIPPLIVEANQAFDRDLPEMLKTHAGLWVAYHGSRRVGFDERDDVLYRLCREQGMGEGEFIVYCVEPMADPVLIGPMTLPFQF